MMASSEYIKIEDGDSGHSLDLFSIPKHYESDLTSVLIPRGLIHDRIEKMAWTICRDLGGEHEPLIVLCVLKGGYRLFADLLEKIQQISANAGICMPLSPDFIRVKSYVDDRSSGIVQIRSIDDMAYLSGKRVLIVEDLIDTGLSMEKLLHTVEEYKPKLVRVASLVVKRTPKSNGYRPDYIGFEVPNYFIVGYAMDYNEHFRDLGHICVINDNGKRKYARR